MFKDVNLTGEPSTVEEVERAEIATGEHAWGIAWNRSSPRLRWSVAGSLALIILVIIAAPRIFSQTLLVRTQLGSEVAKHGWFLEVQSTRIGWFAPLRLQDVSIHDASRESKLHIDQITSDLTFFDLVFGSNDSFGEWVITGVGLHYLVDDDLRSWQPDLLSLLNADGAQGPLPIGQVLVRDISISLRGEEGGDPWRFAKSHVEFNLRPDALVCKFAGVLTEPSGKAGSCRGELLVNVASSPSSTLNESDASTVINQPRWQCELESHSLPISIAALLVGPNPNSTLAISSQVAGEATGTIHLTGGHHGEISMILDTFAVRDLKLIDPMDSTHTWSNRRATVDGQVTIAGDRFISSGIQASTDFATASMKGSCSRSLTWNAICQNPSTFLNRMDGTMTAEIDFASLQESLPGVLPLRDRTKIQAGKLTLTTQPLPSRPSGCRQFAVKTDELRAHVIHRTIAIEPIELIATVSQENGVMSLEKFRFQSEFANVVGYGDWQQGSADLEAHLGLLTEKLRMITNLAGVDIGGSLNGTLRWDLKQRDVWRLSGSGHVYDLHTTLNGEPTIHHDRVDGKFDLAGRWNGQHVEELSQAKLTLIGDDTDLKAELAGPVRNPTSRLPIPIDVEAAGRLQDIASVVQIWNRERAYQADGHFKMNLTGDISAASGRLIGATLELSRPQVAYANRRLAQHKVNVNFDGQWSWPSGDFEAKSLTLDSDAISADLRGRFDANELDCQIAWRASLNHLSSSFPDPLGVGWQSGSPKPIFRTVASRSWFKPASEDWQLSGDCRGQLNLRRSDQAIEIGGQFSGEQLSLLERSSVLPAVTNIQAPTTASNDLRVIWSEPRLQLDGTARYELSTQRTVIDSLRASGDWFATMLTGQATWNADQGEMSLNGPLNVKLPQLGQHLSELAGTQVQIKGTHTAPLAIRLHRTDNGSNALAIDGTLGWESGEVAGVTFGPATLPIRLSESRLEIAPSVVPVGEGKVNLAGEVQYRPGPITIRLRPGVVAESIRLTEGMTDQWLKFVAPAMMRVEKMHGTVGAELDEAIIVVGAPDQTHVAGRLLIERMEMSFTPMMQEVMDTLDKLQTMVHGDARRSRDITDNQITVPDQSIAFDLNLDLVHHERLVFEIGQTKIVCSGYVTLDGRLACIAKIPLEHFAIEGDSRDSTNQFVSLPIFGTINQPLVSPTGLGNVATLIADRTAFDIADELLREQLHRDQALIDDTKTLLHNGKELFQSMEMIEERLRQALDGVGARRQSKKSDEPISTIR